MKIALEEGEKSLENGELPVGAVIFLEDEVISKAFSYGESSRLFLRHAEMNVLWKADEKRYSVSDRKRMQMFVTLEPCMMCLGAAMGFFLGEIYYSVESPIDGAVSFAEEFWQTNHDEIPSYNLPVCYGEILREEGMALLQKYVDLKQEGSLVQFCKTLMGE